MNIRDFKKNKSNEEDMRSVYDKYKNFSHSQLMQELLRTVNEQKNNGTFDKEQLLSTLSLIVPSLSEEQRERIYSMVDKL